MESCAKGSASQPAGRAAIPCRLRPEGKRMTTDVDESRVIPAELDSPTPDTDLANDDARPLGPMEESLRARGSSRNQYGFWVGPGWRMTAGKFETMSKDEQ